MTHVAGANMSFFCHCRFFVRRPGVGVGAGRFSH